MTDCGFLNPFACYTAPVAGWISSALQWFVGYARPYFLLVKQPIDAVLSLLISVANAVPPLVLIPLAGILAWRVGGVRLMIATVSTLLIIGFLGIWSEAITTLVIVFAAVSICLAIGIPLGILAARSDRVFAIMRPVLDGMQTIPAFVYLVPVVMLFGIGDVPGVIVTIIFSIPPVIRLTNLGIRQVPTEIVEAMIAFGASSPQLLLKAQLPVARKAVMAGVNQTLLMALSMVVVASMIAVGGLGQVVLRGIGRLDMGIATVGGIGIVLLAIILDRLTQASGRPTLLGATPYPKKTAAEAIQKQ
ncbi:ABC transporter permease subunit [Mesorhizobium sp. M0207]|uniref:ABC transporter permease n=1 Tax=Mesorhizobium sp. M0207 TaxID=2956915 RepID=UPI003334B2A6